MRSDCKHKCKCGERSAYECRTGWEIMNRTWTRWPKCERVKKAQMNLPTARTKDGKLVTIPED